MTIEALCAIYIAQLARIEQDLKTANEYQAALLKMSYNELLRTLNGLKEVA